MYVHVILLCGCSFVFVGRTEGEGPGRGLQGWDQTHFAPRAIDQREAGECEITVGGVS